MKALGDWHFCAALALALVGVFIIRLDGDAWWGHLGGGLVGVAVARAYLSGARS